MEKENVRAIFEKYLGKGVEYEKYLAKGVSVSSRVGSYICVSATKDTDVSLLHSIFVKAVELLTANGFVYSILLNRILFTSYTIIDNDGLAGLSQKVSEIVSDNAIIKYGITDIYSITYLSDNVSFNNIYIKEIASLS